MMPEWYLAMALLSVMSLCSAFYEPLRFSVGLLALAFVPPAAHAWLCSQRNFFRVEPGRRRERWRFSAATAVLNFLQPAARLAGRLRQGLTPWRRRGAERMILPRARSVAIWSERNWRGPEQRLKALEAAMRESGAVVVHGGDYDAWDLEVRGGMLGNARAALVIEEHGDGRQLVRLRAWPMGLPAALVVSTLFAILAAVAAMDLDWLSWTAFNIPALFLLLRTFYESGLALAVIMNAIPATLAAGEKILEGTKRNERTGIPA